MSFLQLDLLLVWDFPLPWPPPPAAEAGMVRARRLVRRNSNSGGTMVGPREEDCLWKRRWRPMLRVSPALPPISVARGGIYSSGQKCKSPSISAQIESCVKYVTWLCMLLY